MSLNKIPNFRYMPYVNWHKGVVDGRYAKRVLNNSSLLPSKEYIKPEKIEFKNFEKYGQVRNTAINNNPDINMVKNDINLFVNLKTRGFYSKNSPSFSMISKEIKSKPGVRSAIENIKYGSKKNGEKKEGYQVQFKLFVLGFLINLDGSEKLDPYKADVCKSILSEVLDLDKSLLEQWENERQDILNMAKEQRYILSGNINVERA